MSKKTYILLGVLAAGLVFSIATPGQKRLGDGYELDKQITPNTKIDQKPEEILKEPIKIYYYKSTDATCTALLPVTLDDLDKRKSFQEITALHALLTHDVPSGYKSAVINGTVLNSFRVSQGIAYIDLSTFLTLGSGPCELKARKDQIIKTMSQFGGYKEIVLMADGKKVE